MLARAGLGPAAPALQDEYAPVEEWPEKERLAFEKEAIGFYVSGHPLHQYEKELQALRPPVRPRCSAPGGTRRSRSAASCAALRERPTKTGKRMAWVTLEDLSGSMELVCFPGKDGTPLGDGQGRQVGQGGPQAGLRALGAAAQGRTTPSS